MKGGGVKVCRGMFDADLFDAPVLDRRSAKKCHLFHRALLSEPAAATHISDIAVAAEQSARADSRKDAS